MESNPNILGEELLIISKDITYFKDTKERPDLIAIDTNGNIVIIELKRDDSGINLEWQAIKYASYLSKFTINDILNLYEKYLNKFIKQSGEEVSASQIQQNILEFIDEDSFDDVNKKQRLILVSHRFAKEVTSAVNWLIDKYQMDIRCVQLTPFYDKDKDSYYIQSNTILPVPGVEDLIITASDKKYIVSNNESSIRKNDEFSKLCYEIYDALKNDLGDKLPDKKSRLAGYDIRFRYFHFWYSSNQYWHNWEMSYKIRIYQNQADSNNVGIIFEFNKNHLLNNGMDESTLKILEEYIKGYSPKHGYKYYEKNIVQGIETMVKYDKDVIISSLKELIINTYEKIHEILAN